MFWQAWQEVEGHNSDVAWRWDGNTRLFSGPQREMGKVGAVRPASRGSWDGTGTEDVRVTSSASVSQPRKWGQAGVREPGQEAVKINHNWRLRGWSRAVRGERRGGVKRQVGQKGKNEPQFKTSGTCNG